MDTIIPTALSQKEFKHRIDKVNNLRGIVKHNEEMIARFQHQLTENEQMKISIKQELEGLYEMKFVSECLQLSNFQLYNAFEEEKKKLKNEIDQLLSEKQLLQQEEDFKEQQIRKLRDEIEFIKRKATHNEKLLEQQEKAKI